MVLIFSPGGSYYPKLLFWRSLNYLFTYPRKYQNCHRKDSRLFKLLWKASLLDCFYTVRNTKYLFNMSLEHDVICSPLVALAVVTETKRISGPVSVFKFQTHLLV